MKKTEEFIRRIYTLFSEHRLNTAAAGLAYYITMTFFPFLICLYTLLGNNYETAMEALTFVRPFIPGRAYEAILEFMEYVAGNYSVVMMVFAFSVILFTASAAFRSLENTIAKMQGEHRYAGYPFYLISILLSLGFVVTMHLAIVVMFLGSNILRAINEFLPFLDLEYMVLNLRFLLLFAVAFVIIYLIFWVCRCRRKSYSILIGAITSTALLVGVSAVFSVFINASIKYPLVYSSLASVIMLMIWLYNCCTVIYAGAAVNIVIRDMKTEKASP